ncbi:MAG: LacI family DNA-binding transcriptional regulator, partial [Chloroflexota bacterium]
DDEAAGREVVEHLVKLGHRQIAVLPGPGASSASSGRMAGYRQALEAAGLDLPEERWLEGNLTRESGYAGAATLLEAGGPPPTAIVCGNDAMALGAIDAVIDRGWRVPEDVAVVGFDNMSFASSRLIGLTTIDQSLAGTGAVAAQLLLDRIENPRRPPQTIILPHHLVIRRTCGGHRSEGLGGV